MLPAILELAATPLAQEAMKRMDADISGLLIAVKWSKKKSEITSFRMNRFNNFFQGAAALLYHKEEITNFLSQYKNPLNL